MRNNQHSLIASVLLAAGHPFRIELLEFLQAKGEASVIDISRELKIDQSLTSHHLGMLVKAGFINYTRKGKFNFYFIASDTLYSLLTITKKHLGSTKKH